MASIVLSRCWYSTVEGRERRIRGPHGFVAGPDPVVLDRAVELALDDHLLRAGGRPTSGSTTIVPCIPIPMCSRTGLVPQLERRPGGGRRTKRCGTRPARRRRNPSRGDRVAIRSRVGDAVGVAKRYLDRVSLGRAQMTGPGTLPLKLKARIFTPGATVTFAGFATRPTSTVAARAVPVAAVREATATPGGLPRSKPAAVLGAGMAGHWSFRPVSHSGLCAMSVVPTGRFRIHRLSRVPLGRRLSCLPPCRRPRMPPRGCAFTLRGPITASKHPREGRSPGTRSSSYCPTPAPKRATRSSFMGSQPGTARSGERSAATAKSRTTPITLGPGGCATWSARAEYDKVQAKVARDIKSPPNHHLFDFNCTHWVLSLVRDGSRRLPHRFRGPAIGFATCSRQRSVIRQGRSLSGGTRGGRSFPTRTRWSSDSPRSVTACTSQLRSSQQEQGRFASHRRHSGEPPPRVGPPTSTRRRSWDNSPFVLRSDSAGCMGSIPSFANWTSAGSASGISSRSSSTMSATTALLIAVDWDDAGRARFEDPDFDL